MTSSAPASPNADAAQGQVEVVIDNHHVFDSNGALTQQAADRNPAAIHERLRLGQNRDGCIHDTFSDQCLTKQLFESDRVLRRNSIHHKEAKVVARSLVPRTGVAQADD